jgi:hydrogenase/urease accessory protein HupE
LVRHHHVDETLTEQFVYQATPRYVLASGAVDTGKSAPTAADVASPPAMAAYFTLGIEHLWTGADHLVFILLVTLTGRTPRRMIMMATAFTVGHSLTLIATTLGWLTIDTTLTEALIALSILLFAAEALRQDKPPSTSVILVPTLFGLVHGLGFAGVLKETGLPEGEHVGALLLFNLGIETGQLLFILLALVTVKIVHQRYRRSVERLLIEGCGIAGGFWLLARIV